jgi:hypothetical protein
MATMTESEFASSIEINAVVGTTQSASFRVLGLLLVASESEASSAAARLLRYRKAAPSVMSLTVTSRSANQALDWASVGKALMQIVHCAIWIRVPVFPRVDRLISKLTVLCKQVYAFMLTPWLLPQIFSEMPG